MDSIRIAAEPTRPVQAHLFHSRRARAQEWVLQLLRGARRHSRLISVVLVISLGSKLLGLAREVYISSCFGVSSITDAFFGVQQLPVMMMSYMAGAFTLAFIPHYVALKEHGRQAEFLKRLLIISAGIAGVATIVMIAGADTLIPAIVSTPSGKDLTAQFSIVLAIALVPSVVIGIAYGVCHAEREHSKAMLLAAAGPAAMLMSLLAWDHWPASDLRYALPWSYVIGTLVAAAWAAKRIAVAFESARVPVQNARSECPRGRKFAQQLSAASIENVAFSLNQLLTVHFAASTGEGGVTFNAYALRIAMLPLSGAVTPLYQIVNTWLAKQHVTQQKSAFVKALLLLGGACCLCAIVMYALRHIIVRLVYQRGVFSAADAASVAQVLSPYMGYFVVMALNQLFARFYFVAGKGQVYTGVLLAGYLIGNVLKPIGASEFGLVGVISGAVAGEGLALVALTVLFLRYRARTEAWTRG